MPCGGRLSRTSASGQGHTGFRGRQTGQTSARSEARGRHGLVSGHLVVLGQLVPPLDLATGQAGVPLPGHAVVTGAALQLLAAATRAPAAIVTLNIIKTALYAAHNMTNNGPDVFEQCVLEVPLLREANNGFLASVLHLLGRGPQLCLHADCEVTTHNLKLSCLKCGGAGARAVRWRPEPRTDPCSCSQQQSTLPLLSTSHGQPSRRSLRSFILKT